MAPHDRGSAASGPAPAGGGGGGGEGGGAGQGQPAPVKARLRGAIHHYAAFVALAIGILLVFDAQTPKARLGCIIYGLSTTTMFSASALYHRPNWQPKMRALMRRLDHAAIFLVIAGTNTPLALIALPPEQSARLLSIVWGGALIGVSQCVIFSHAPKALAAGLYVALGWAALPFVQRFSDVLPAADVVLIVVGGVVYSLGALIYAARRPDPIPHFFGYHEVFHLFVTIGALLHFAAVYRVVRSPLGAGGIA